MSQGFDSYASRDDGIGRAMAESAAYEASKKANDLEARVANLENAMGAALALIEKLIAERAPN